MRYRDGKHTMTHQELEALVARQGLVRAVRQSLAKERCVLERVP